MLFLKVLARVLHAMATMNTAFTTAFLEAAVKEVEYFDDENLDAFIGRESDSYTEKEIEQFREILYTMNQKEVADWNRSLTIRGINIPNDLKDEMIMMIENN